MSLIQLVGVSKGYGGKPILSNVNLDISKGNKVGIIGLNGSGKTTLLKLITGELESEGGSIAKAKGLRVAYVQQFLDAGSEKTILDLCYEQHPDLAGIKKTLLDCEAKMSSPSFGESSDMQKVLDRYAAALEDFQARGGYTLEHVIDSHLKQIGLKNLTPDRVLAQLSAGELKIAQIAAALSTNPDLLIVDEPTNHADTFTSEAIDNIIIRYDGTVVYVTHDRYLLNKVKSRIVEVRDNDFIEFSGTYDDYLDYRQNSFNADMRRYKSQEQHKANLTDSMLRLKGKGYAGSDKAAKRAKVMERRIEQMNLKKPDAVTQTLNVSIQKGEKGGFIVLRTDGLYKRFGEREVLRDVTLEINSGQRVGLVGNSGSGKTTLLNCLLGFEKPDSGTVWMGPSIQPGYLSQADINLNLDSSIYDELKKAGCADTNAAYGLLKRWLFREYDINQRIGSLSGGEKKKIQLMKIMLTKPNFLVLDEPTDHLDMVSREGLEGAVSEFDGTVFVVSHDRYFLDEVTDSTVILADKKLIYLPGSYSENLGKINQHLKR